MEVYNTLLQQFHLADTPTHNSIHYQHILNQLSARRRKQQHKFQQIQIEINKQNISVIQNTHIYSSRSITQSRISETSTTEHKFDQSSIERQELLQQISSLRKQIVSLRQKRTEVSQQLRILTPTQQQSNSIQHQCYSQTLHAHQNLKMLAARCNTEETHQQGIVMRLKRRKYRLEEEITEMTERKQRGDGVVDRWRKSKLKVKLTTLKQKKINIDKIESILRVFYLLLRMDLAIKLDTPFEIKTEEKNLPLPSKLPHNIHQLLQFYHNRKVFMDEIMIKKITQLHVQLELQFSRNEAAQTHILAELQTHKDTDEKLTLKLQEINHNKRQNSQQILLQFENNTRSIEQHFSNNSRLIHILLCRLFELVKKMTTIRETTNEILAKRDKSKQYQLFGEECRALQEFQFYLCRNPAETSIGWSQCGQSFYNDQIKSNPLLRFFCHHNTYSSHLNSAENLELVTNLALRKTDTLAFQFSKQLAKHFELTRLDTSVPIKSNPDYAFCMESKQYFRRDNYKLLQKLERQQLRKRGLLVKFPINFRDEELIQQNIRELRQCPSEPRCSLMRKRSQLRYTENKSSKQLQTNHHLRMLMSRISTLRSRSSSRINHSFNSTLATPKTIRIPRLSQQPIHSTLQKQH